MDWIDDIDRGAWLRDRITGDGGFPAVAGVGWEAYARILHPAEAFGDVAGEFVLEQWTWAEAARRRGLTLNPLVDWNTIGRQAGQVEVDGFTLSPGQEGCLEPELLRVLAGLLASATSTPDDIVIGIWDGFGPVGGDDGAVEAVAVLTDGAADASTPAAPTEAELTALLHRLAAEASERLLAGELRPEPAQAPILALPGRDYYLAATTLAALPDQAGSDDDLRNGIQLVWPAGQEWVVASEIDFDSTVVGGSRALIDAVVADARLEAFEVGEDDLFDVAAGILRP